MSSTLDAAMSSDDRCRRFRTGKIHAHQHAVHAAKPQLLLFLDEPTSGLDGQSAYNIVCFLKKLTAAGQASSVQFTNRTPSFSSSSIVYYSSAAAALYTSVQLARTRTRTTLLTISMRTVPNARQAPIQQSTCSTPSVLALSSVWGLLTGWTSISTLSFSRRTRRRFVVLTSRRSPSLGRIPLLPPSTLRHSCSSFVLSSSELSFPSGACQTMDSLGQLNPSIIFGEHTLTSCVVYSRIWSLHSSLVSPS
jgi:hypothetical protein